MAVGSSVMPRNSTTYALGACNQNVTQRSSCTTDDGKYSARLLTALMVTQSTRSERRFIPGYLLKRFLITHGAVSLALDLMPTDEASLEAQPVAIDQGLGLWMTGDP